MRKPVLTILVTLLAAILLLYRIDIDLRLQWPRETTIADPETEAAFQACFAAQDDEIHTTAFGSIDNPDVQKEFISSNRASAVRTCRELHPEREIQIKQPLEFNLIDLTPRFWS